MVQVFEDIRRHEYYMALNQKEIDFYSRKNLAFWKEFKTVEDATLEIAQEYENCPNSRRYNCPSHRPIST